MTLFNLFAKYETHNHIIQKSCLNRLIDIYLLTNILLHLDCISINVTCVIVFDNA